MNALTKALVVVVTVLAVILVALVVPFAARVPDYAADYRDAKAAHQAQVQKNNQALAEARTALAQQGEANAQLQSEVEQLTAELAMAKANITAEQAKVREAQTVMARATAAQEVLALANQSKDAQITKQADLIQTYIGDLGDTQARNLELSQSLIETNAENRRLSNSYLRIQEENKALLQQLSEKQARIDAMVPMLVAAGYDVDQDTLPTKTADPILGSVVAIDSDTPGLTFVQVNVGTRDNVQEGMEFTVYRGDSFVGKIQIATVDTAQAVGQLTLGGGVREGDAVRAGGR